MVPPHSPGSPVAKAREVMVAVSPWAHMPVVRITKPVMEMTTRVSTNVWVMDTSPWRTGWLVWAMDAAIEAVPMPDSLENSERAAPMRMATSTVEPTNPPVAPMGVNAPVKISRRASGMPS